MEVIAFIAFVVLIVWLDRRHEARRRNQAHRRLARRAVHRS